VKLCGKASAGLCADCICMGGVSWCAQVTEQDIANIVAQWTGIPIEKVSADETERLIKMEEVLHGRVIGQVRPRFQGPGAWLHGCGHKDGCKLQKVTQPPLPPRVTPRPPRPCNTPSSHVNTATMEC
jgi:hypothetical protein